MKSPATQRRNTTALIEHSSPHSAPLPNELSYQRPDPIKTSYSGPNRAKSVADYSARPAGHGSQRNYSFAIVGKPDNV